MNVEQHCSKAHICIVCAFFLGLYKSYKGPHERGNNGKIVNAVALRGEVKIYSYSDPYRFEELERIYVENEPKKIEKVRCQGNVVIVKLSGINDRNMAEAIKGKNVYIDESELPELPEDTYYIRDLIGMNVETQEGKHIGILKDVIQNTAQDLYEIETEDKRQILIPGVGEFVVKIDMEERNIVVKVIEGLLEL